MNLKKLLLTENNCYIVGEKITPTGIMVHSTGANNPTLKRYIGPNDGFLGVNANNNHWNQPKPDGREVCVHAFIGKLADGAIATYQTLPWDMRGWHSGGSANNTHIGFEICEDDTTDADYFGKIYQEAVELCAMLCRTFGIKPEKPDLICHSEGNTLKIASAHSDVMHWFPKHGKNMDVFRSDVKNAIENTSLPYAIDTVRTVELPDETASTKKIRTRRKSTLKPDPDTKFPVPNLETVIYVKPTIKNKNIIVGDFTYFSDTDFESRVTHHYDFYGDKLIIGKFCQIAKGVEFIMNGVNHKINAVSTFPFYILEGWKQDVPSPSDMPLKGDTVVGNDVWIGQNAVILPGVLIGDGAIIGANSVVGNDVVPYTIVVGNPAKPVRKRFDDELIALLEEFKWWDLPIAEINKLIPLLSNSNLNRVKNTLTRKLKKTKASI